MKRGEAILEYLVKRADGAQDPKTIAKAIGKPDGRSISDLLRHLERVGLVYRTGEKRTRSAALWYPTARGREVDAILDRITAARGGEFIPTAQAGIAWSEIYALRR